MNNLKRKVSLILSIMMVALAIFPLTMSMASTSTNDMTMSVKINGTGIELKNEYEYNVSNGDKIHVEAASTNGASVAFIAYYFEDGSFENRTKVSSNKIDIAVPNKAVGTVEWVAIEAVASTNTGTNDPTNRTKWQYYFLRWVEKEQPVVQEDVSIDAKFGGKTLVDKSTTTTAVPGDKIDLVATPSERVKSIWYKWDSNDAVPVNSAKTTITIPTSFKPGSTHYLYVMVRDNDGKDSPQKTYKFVIPSEEPVEPIVAEDVEPNAKIGDKVLADLSTTKTAVPGDKIDLVATPSEKVKSIWYKWDSDDAVPVNSAKTTITIPTTFKPGSTHYLYVIARDINGKDSKQKSYKFIFPSDDPVDPVNPEDSDLEILPWEKENNDLNALAISLRNDSESDKANKNVYALDEKVTYFIDYKNGGKDINDEVTIKLELPLQFEVIDSDGGVVDANKGTITWTYPNGMEKDQEGTKTVIIKYTSFGKKSTDSEIIYPLATISKAGKIADDSAVINLIYRDEDTVITDTHMPYMYGDKNATTFRPDDTISRAEGALVLTRILLGQSAIDNVKVTSVYPDLNQTYEEAQKAIIAATSYGIINGYTDGYYRPNQKMTRAEFMKILAKFIELDADDNGIKGLEIKNLENSVKMYKDPVIRYVIGGTTVSEHWAIEEVTLLARLNMTSVSSKEKNLRLDEEITRAEVAQLVNFYLLRAPAEVNSRTTTQFSDVSRKHDLFADIVEATREAHDFRITEDGTEIAE